MGKIVVLSDTHERRLEKISPQILQAIRDAELVVHCGDYVGLEILGGMQKLAKKFIGVYGNTDPGDIRERLPNKTVFEFQGKCIGVIHPHWGGPPFDMEEIVREFSDVDAILFGHTHEACNVRLNGLLLLNPGQAYASFMVPASLAILQVSEHGVAGEIVTLT